MVPRLLLEHRVPLLFCPPTLLHSSLPCPQLILHPCSTPLFLEVFSGEQKPGGFTMGQGMKEPSFLPSIPLLIWQIVAVLISNSGFIISITEIFPTTST